MKLVLVIVAALMSQACVMAPKHTPMTQDTYNAVKTLKTYNLVIQDEVKPAVKLSNATGMLGGGLIAAAIDSSVNDGRATSARDIAEPLYNSTVDVDYRKLIAEQLNPALSERFNLTNIENSAQAVVLRNDEIEARAEKLADGEAFLFLSSAYQFREEFRMLQTTTLVYLFTAKEGPRSWKKPDYYNVVNYQSQSVGAGGAASISKWSENNGQLFRNELTQSLVQTKNMIMYDMQPILNERCIVKGKIHIPNQLNTVTLKGSVVKEDQDLTLFRLDKGELFSVSSASVMKGNAKCEAGA